MLCSIGDFLLADGTLSGGWSLSGYRQTVERVFDFAIPIGAINPVGYDRGIHRTVIEFQIIRVHASAAAAEEYAADHDTAVPSSGLVALTTTDGVTRYLINAALIQHTRVGGLGKQTVHAYHIEGGLSRTPSGDFILTESGGYVLQEDGTSKVLLEIVGPPPVHFVLTESGDHLLTEDGGHIETEF